MTPRPNSRLRPRNRAGRCFELSGRYQIDDPTWTLVHGTLYSAEFDICYGHAWLKRDGWVYDAVQNETFCAEEYATRFGAEEIGSFSYREAARAVLDSGRWGPWVTYDKNVMVRAG
jgi:hypothetical protein